MLEEFKRENTTVVLADKVTNQRLIEAAEKAKIELSSMTSTNINLPFITADNIGAKHLNLTLTRAKLMNLQAI